MRSIFAVLLYLVFAGPASANNGVLEINQVCAVNTGCFSGDTAGFPVTITTPGSYRLVSNLTLPDVNTDGIVVSTNDVGIDLNNFSIIGPVTCAGSPLICTPGSGTGRGVAQTLTSNRGISVKEGSIAGAGAHGVLLGDQAVVTNVRVRWSRLVGINVGSGSTISGNTAHQNASIGIFANSGSTISGNTAYQNGSGGIFTNSGSTVSNNTAYQNGATGIFAGAGSTVSGNTAYNNLGDGVVVGSGSTVQRNAMRLNGGFGLNLGAEAGYRENTITSNMTGTVIGSGVNMGGNSCNGISSCP